MLVVDVDRVRFVYIEGVGGGLAVVPKLRVHRALVLRDTGQHGMVGRVDHRPGWGVWTEQGRRTLYRLYKHRFVEGAREGVWRGAAWARRQRRPIRHPLRNYSPPGPGVLRLGDGALTCSLGSCSTPLG